ncbi:MAG: AbrB/MazE/SpoVT family DNA-binding domain-containing protein [Coriobacteriia bacterium]|nr:AbrB/MazE/SpoVT family DNA-binding domain-containing protein [Coriobacteriia bacterium]
MTSITLSSKGQFVVPANIRKQAGVSTGDQFFVRYDEKSQEIRLKRAKTIDEQADRFTSFIKPGVKPLENASDFYSQREPRI